MSFARSLFTVSGFTVLSRVGGFIRDTLTAIFLGAGPVADAFFVAQRLPNLFRSLFAEGAFSAAFVPLYTTEEDRHGTSAAQQFAGQALALLMAVLIPFSALIILFMPYVTAIQAPGFEYDFSQFTFPYFVLISAPDKFDLAVNFSQITFPYLALISVTALQSGVLNAHNRFGPGAFAPVALNVVMIAGLALAHIFKWHIGYTLSWALTISGVVQMGWLAISCWRAKLSIPIVWPRMTDSGRKLFKRIGPGAVGSGATQINLVVSTMLASTLSTGAVSWLYYADRLEQLPLGIVGIAVGTTLLPVLSRYIAAGDEEKARHYMSRGIEFCLVLGLPAAVGLIVAAEPIVRTLWEHGRFSSADTQATAEAVAAYSLGIPPTLLVRSLSAGFFARHNTTTPVKIAFVAMTVNVVGSIVMLGPLQHIGIALANSLAVWVNATLLYTRLRRDGPVGDDRLRRRAPRLLFCAAIMGVLTWALVQGTADWFDPKKLLQECVALGFVIGLSGMVYAVALQLTGAMQVQEILKLLKRGKGGVPDESAP